MKLRRSAGRLCGSISSRGSLEGVAIRRSVMAASRSGADHALEKTPVDTPAVTECSLSMSNTEVTRDIP
jgi:hypothetical protein